MMHADYHLIHQCIGVLQHLPALTDEIPNLVDEGGFTDPRLCFILQHGKPVGWGSTSLTGRILR